MKNNFIHTLKLLFNGFFHGLKSADEIISQDATYGGGGTEIIQHKTIGGVFDDMLQQKETQQVKETRDAYYRVYREADKYDVSVEGDFSEDATSDLRAKVRKKVPADFLKHCNVYNENGYYVRLIQDNKLTPKKSNFGFEDRDIISAESEQYVPLIDIERDDFIPRFKIENYANKIVVRERENGKTRIDFYTTIYASQFGKVDALYIAELNRILNNEEYRKTDTLLLKTIRFVSDKAFGVEDLFLFEYNNIKFVTINIYDGNFVLSFDVDVVYDGKDITEKYHTKELDDKYKNNAPKKDAIDIFTLKRHIDKEEASDDIDLGTTTFKLS